MQISIQFPNLFECECCFKAKNKHKEHCKWPRT